MGAGAAPPLWIEFAYVSNYARPLVPGDLMMPWGWSLALEEQFYLAVPCSVLLYKLRATRRASPPSASSGRCRSAYAW